MTSLLIGLPPGLNTFYFKICAFFTHSFLSFLKTCLYHLNLCYCIFVIISSIPSLSLISLLENLSVIVLPRIHLIILISAHWSVNFSFFTGHVSLPCNIQLYTQHVYDFALIRSEMSLLVNRGKFSFIHIHFCTFTLHSIPPSIKLFNQLFAFCYHNHNHPHIAPPMARHLETLSITITNSSWLNMEPSGMLTFTWKLSLLLRTVLTTVRAPTYRDYCWHSLAIYQHLPCTLLIWSLLLVNKCFFQIHRSKIVSCFSV